MEIKTILEEEIEDELNELSELELGSEKYDSAINGITKLMDRKIEMDKLESERKEKVETRDIENDFRSKQMDDEKKDRWVRNGISVASILVPTVVTIWGTYKTLKFEETGTITTSMGRGFINKLIPKK